MPKRSTLMAYTMKMAANDALCLSCVCSSCVTSPKDHSGHRSCGFSASHFVQLTLRSTKHATLPRSFSLTTFVPKLPENVNEETNIVARITAFAAIKPMKSVTAKFFHRLSALRRMEKADRNHPAKAAIMKRPDATRYSNPTHELSAPELELSNEDGEYRKIAPTKAQPAVGKVNHAGTLVSLDFCTIGFVMMRSRELIMNTSSTSRQMPHAPMQV
mmetsp:Transcript_28031/g.78597  ORF Transcript_28031/g.78597 Transcript_28031/m.78597 type:complete len:216 (-) Transcript_28031:618-1265(-)